MVLFIALGWCLSLYSLHFVGHYIVLSRCSAFTFITCVSITCISIIGFPMIDVSRV
jgi:hypothetical protein